jgi:hypothetical protein
MRDYLICNSIFVKYFIHRGRCYLLFCNYKKRFLFLSIIKKSQDYFSSKYG